MAFVTSGENEIRGLDIDKLVKGFADEEIIFKSHVMGSTTSARELRWYKKTSGFLTGVSSTDTHKNTDWMDDVDSGALPTVQEQSTERQQTFIRKYFVQSPLITEEDIKDSDVDIFAINIRDLVRAIARRVDRRIYNITSDFQATGSQSVGTFAATGTGWDDISGGNPILDMMAGQQAIREQGYDTSNLTVAMNPKNHKDLMNYIITVKGSSIPEFASDQLKHHVVMRLLNTNIVVSTNVVADSITMWVTNRASTWKTFMPIKSAIIVDEGLGRTIRVWEEGECILTDPGAVYVITDTDT